MLELSVKMLFWRFNLFKRGISVKRLVFCLVANIIFGISVLMSFWGHILSYNLIKEHYQAGGETALSPVIGRERIYLIIEMLLIIIVIACIIILVSLINRERRHEESRPIVINQNGTINDSQTTYVTPGYSGGAGHRVNPKDFGGSING